jgi:hypothetical protein
MYKDRDVRRLLIVAVRLLLQLFDNWPFDDWPLLW